MATLRWRLAHGVHAAFSPAAAGDQRDPQRRAAWSAACCGPRPVVVPRQLHGAAVVVARAGEPPAEADGLVTDNATLAVGVFGADCPGLVLAAPDALAVAHCGWRGTAAGIVTAAVAALARHSRHPPSTWAALIGPGISAARYEVDAPVLTARVWDTIGVSTRPGHALLDVPGQVAADCRQAGLSDITASGICTASDPRLRSHRHHGPGDAMLLLAWRDTGG
jgi:hypothetical protein